MASNSKLTAGQKIILKAWKRELAELGGAIATSEDGRVTVAWVPAFKGSKILHTAWAIASQDEKKIRTKVGEFRAIDRLFKGQTLPVEDGTDMFSLAEALAGF